MRKWTSILMAVVLLFVFAMPVLAAEETQEPGVVRLSDGSYVSPFWENLSRVINGLLISDDGYAEISVSGATYNRSDRIDLTVTLQKASGSSWTDYKTWKASDYGICDIDEVYKVGSGVYKVKAVLKVYDSSGKYIETVTTYSKTDSY